MAIVKLLLLLTMLSGQHYSTTAPNARPPSGELRQQVRWEAAILWMPILLKFFFWLWTLSESAVLFAATDYCPPGLSQSIAHYLVRSNDPQRALTHISSLTPTFLLSIRKEHKLVTSGVYAIVRHPSYTGAISIVLGFLLCGLSRHSWLVACSPLFPDPGIETRMMNVLASTFTSMFVGVVALLVQRMNNEDAMLEKNFGEEWKSWAKRVPCRLVPWVY
ncbi:hypothetical protein BDN67DRAFT_968241 [Paxillus ammoniavirescens]|nr:hypothetical protein BDN67DRAFT_968241 [Paxillus ammoniavirescens]